MVCGRCVAKSVVCGGVYVFCVLVRVKGYVSDWCVEERAFYTYLIRA